MHHCGATISVKKKKGILGLFFFFSKLEETRCLPDWCLGILELFKINCSKFAGYYAHVQQQHSWTQLKYICWCTLSTAVRTTLFKLQFKALGMERQAYKMGTRGTTKMPTILLVQRTLIVLCLFCLFCTLAFPYHEYLPARSAFWHILSTNDLITNALLCYFLLTWLLPMLKTKDICFNISCPWLVHKCLFTQNFV